MIHVAYRLWGGDGFFAKMLGTSMLSMFENTKEKVTIHIMHNERLTPDNRDKFCYIAGQYNQRVEFHNVEEIAGSTLRKFEAAYPLPSGINASWYPLIVHEVFPNLDKLIFLGADTIFNLDVAELWSYDLMRGGCGLAAVSEYFMKGSHEVLPVTKDGYARHEDCFNADVLLVKPDFFRENFEQLLSACKFVYDKGYYLCEQDALNYLYAEKYLHLPSKFNVILSQLRKYMPKPYRLEKAIYHFNIDKPSFDTDDIYNRLYWNYFFKTPWATPDMLGNLNKALEKTFGQILNDSRNLTLNVTNLLSERRRAFLVAEGFVESVKKIFAIKPDEPVIDLSEGGEMLIKRLNEKKGQIILFILANNYWQIRNFLISRNFVEETDFVNAALFLSERHGVKFNLNTTEIVQAI